MPLVLSTFLAVRDRMHFKTNLHHIDGQLLKKKKSSQIYPKYKFSPLITSLPEMTVRLSNNPLSHVWIWHIGSEKIWIKDCHAQSPMLQTVMSTPFANKSFYTPLRTFLDLLFFFIDFQALKACFHLWQILCTQSEILWCGVFSKCGQFVYFQIFPFFSDTERS